MPRMIDRAAKLTRDNILFCLELNVEQANTKALRTFAQERLDSYREHVKKVEAPEPEAPAAFAHFERIHDEEEQT